VLAEDYRNFFAKDGASDRLRYMFCARLVQLRRPLAENIIASRYDAQAVSAFGATPHPTKLLQELYSAGLTVGLRST
jgi:hypothetical protein